MIKKLKIIAIAMFIFISFCIIFYISLSVKNQSNFILKESHPLDITRRWQYHIGDCEKDYKNNNNWELLSYNINPSNIQKSNIMWLRVQFPDNIPQNTFFYFVTKYQYVEVYSGNKLIYNFGDIDKSNSKIVRGAKYHVIPTEKISQNDFLYFRTYSNNNYYLGKLEDVKIGYSSELILSIINNNFHYFILGYLTLFIGFFMVFIYFLRTKDQKSFLGLGIFCICLSFWYLTASDIKFFLIKSPVVSHYINIICLHFIPIGMCYFIENTFKMKYKSILRYIRYIFIYFAMITIITDVLGLINIFSMLKFYHVLLMVCGTILVAAIIKSIVKLNQNAIVYSTGIALLGIYCIIDINYWYYTSQFHSQLSTLIFVILLVVILIKKLFFIYDQLKHHYEEIEKVVAERTKELEYTNDELKVTLNTLQETQSSLIESEKMAALGNLVAGISHEINTPVGIGVTAASHLYQKTQEFIGVYKEGHIKRSEFEKYLNTCSESSNMILFNLNRASELVSSFKKIAVDQSIEEKRLFNFKKYLNNILLSLKPKLKKHKIMLICDEALQIYSYPGAISQIITNLIMNSIIHAYDEEQTGELRLIISNSDNQIFFEYSDDGKGVAENIVDKIFDPFFTTKRGKGGTGLGLNIVYNLVTQTLNGTITCKSTEEKGTKFVISFPIDKQL